MGKKSNCNETVAAAMRSAQTPPLSLTSNSPSPLPHRFSPQASYGKLPGVADPAPAPPPSLLPPPRRRPGRHHPQRYPRGAHVVVGGVEGVEGPHREGLAAVPPTEQLEQRHDHDGEEGGTCKQANPAWSTGRLLLVLMDEMVYRSWSSSRRRLKRMLASELGPRSAVSAKDVTPPSGSFAPRAVMKTREAFRW